MTTEQYLLYWTEWRKLSDMLCAKAKSLWQIEDYRQRLTQRALGAAKSDHELTSREFEQVLALMKADQEPANLDVQIAVQESGGRRRAFLLDRCFEVCSRMWSHGNDSRLLHRRAREGYIRGTARNVIKKELEACEDDEIAKVLGCLTARLQRLEKQFAGSCPTGRGALDGARL